MSLPPPQGPFGHQPPLGGGGQPGSGPPQPGHQPRGGHAGPPQGGPPPWGPQHQWTGGPPPPNGGAGKAKWILGGIAVVLAIALAVVVTVLVIRPDSGDRSSTAGTDGSNSEISSANDTGPVNIITEDPTCEAWDKVGQEYADKLAAVGWGERDTSVPAPAWTREQRGMYAAAGQAMSRAADDTVDLLKRTPHRVIRELYGQFVAYVREFVVNVDSYHQSANDLVVVSDSSANALSRICAAIGYASASAVKPFIDDPAPQTSAAPVEAPESTVRFLSSANTVCADWTAEVAKVSDATKAWQSLDANVPAGEWTPEQQAVIDAVAPVMLNNADELERLGRRSGNPVLEDFAVLAAQYRRAYVKALPSYTSRDNYLAQSATYLVKTVTWACKTAPS